MSTVGLIFGVWVFVALVIAHGIGIGLRHEDEAAEDFDDAVDQALAAVADIEAADCRLWELECGWQV